MTLYIALFESKTMNDITKQTNKQTKNRGCLLSVKSLYNQNKTWRENQDIYLRCSWV